MNALNAPKITHICWILWLIAFMGLPNNKAVAQVPLTVDFSLSDLSSQLSVSAEQSVTPEQLLQQAERLFTKDFPVINFPNNLNITQTPIIWLSCKGGSQANNVLIIHRSVISYNFESMEGNIFP
ncbi:MAG: hypothetical protein HC768_19820 [Acaryochloris sp. CRU_2_0]|nr:hypothetical protein [Acaryochloris sp. CRU_2_0]